MHEVALNSVNYSYGSHQVLRDINFTAAAGDFSRLDLTDLYRGLLADLHQPKH